jgi:hypothetical protein
MLSKIHPGCFTWSLWRGGCLLDLVPTIAKNRDVAKKAGLLRKYAIGYCIASELLVRPKTNCFAVMFLKEELCFWTHLTVVEFNKMRGT